MNSKLIGGTVPILLASLFGASVLGFAGTGVSRHLGIAKHFRDAFASKAADRYGITEEQKAKFKALKAEIKSGAEAIRNKSELSDEQKRDELRTLLAQIRAEKEQLLTANNGRKCKPIANSSEQRLAND